MTMLKTLAPQLLIPLEPVHKNEYITIYWRANKNYKPQVPSYVYSSIPSIRLKRKIIQTEETILISNLLSKLIPNRELMIDIHSDPSTIKISDLLELLVKQDCIPSSTDVSTEELLKQSFSNKSNLLPYLSPLTTLPTRQNLVSNKRNAVKFTLNDSKISYIDTDLYLVLINNKEYRLYKLRESYYLRLEVSEAKALQKELSGHINNFYIPCPDKSLLACIDVSHLTKNYQFIGNEYKIIEGNVIAPIELELDFDPEISNYIKYSSINHSSLLSDRIPPKINPIRIYEKRLTQTLTSGMSNILSKIKMKK